MRIGTYNIRVISLRDGFKHCFFRRLASIAKVIQEADCDILGIQESNTILQWWALRIALRLKGLKYKGVYQPFSEQWIANRGIGILYKKDYKLLLKKKISSIANRDMQNLVFVNGHTTVSVVNMHLKVHEPLTQIHDFRWAFNSKVQAARTFILGDFNFNLNLNQELVAKLLEAGFAGLNTGYDTYTGYGDPVPGMAIDNIVTNNTMYVNSIQDSKASDHNILFAWD